MSVGPVYDALLYEAQNCMLIPIGSSKDFHRLPQQCSWTAAFMHQIVCPFPKTTDWTISTYVSLFKLTHTHANRYLGILPLPCFLRVIPNIHLKKWGDAYIWSKDVKTFNASKYPQTLYILRTVVGIQKCDCNAFYSLPTLVCDSRIRIRLAFTRIWAPAFKRVSENKLSSQHSSIWEKIDGSLPWTS